MKEISLQNTQPRLWITCYLRSFEGLGNVLNRQSLFLPFGKHLCCSCFFDRILAECTHIHRNHQKSGHYVQKWTCFSQTHWNIRKMPPNWCRNIGINVCFQPGVPIVVQRDIGILDPQQETALESSAIHVDFQWFRTRVGEIQCRNTGVSPTKTTFPALNFPASARKHQYSRLNIDDS